MTKFRPAKSPPGEYEKIRRALHQKPMEWFTQYLGHEPTPKEKHEFVEASIRDLKVDTLWLNDTYQVAIRPAAIDIPDFPEMLHLSIKRRDKEPIHDWRELQAIKDELVGPENEGVELYPAHSRVMDTANQYHMFVLKEAGIQFPFGFQGRRVVNDDALAGSKQRKLNNND